MPLGLMFIPRGNGDGSAFLHYSARNTGVVRRC